MKNTQQNEEEKEDVVAVAIDKNKGSQFALKWAVDHLLKRGQTVTLIHVKHRQQFSSFSSPNIGIPSSNVGADGGRTLGLQSDQEIFVAFRSFCSRKEIKCNEVILEEMDISKALIDYAHMNCIEIMVVGASSKNVLVSRRLKGPDVATILTKSAPEFCTVYVIAKGKMLSIRPATRPVPRAANRNPSQSHTLPNVVNTNDALPMVSGAGVAPKGETSSFTANKSIEETDMFRSPFTRARAANGRTYGDASMPECDISFVSSGRPSTDRSSIDRAPYDHGSYDMMEFGHTPRLSNGFDVNRMSSTPLYLDRKSIDVNCLTEYSSSNCSGFSSNTEDVESEVRRLKQELKQTMEMYNVARKEAVTGKQTANDLQKLKMSNNQKLEDARLAEEAAMGIVENEKAKCKAAMEAAESAQRIADSEAQKRINAEMKALKEAEETKKVVDALTQKGIRYRKYSIEEIEIATDNFSDSRKIGEGGYGPVYKCTLDHTPVAVKVLRADAAQGQSQFQQEVEILSSIRHPNMVLLLGACPEYGCLVYEYMSKGSLEDCLVHKGNSPGLPWQLRFRIAAEIGTGLLFLHQTKPEPLVHRDLKPANILLDQNYVSKISDVGLARLVPPSTADLVTQYRMTQAAGTFCYIDPEYQQTGLLGTKSDVYSLGILFLQLITAKPAMGLTHQVQRAIERGTFGQMLDPSVQDWPFEQALLFAKLSLKCAELRKKDRPDLAKVLLPELNRLREFAEENMSFS